MPSAASRRQCANTFTHACGPLDCAHGHGRCPSRYGTTKSSAPRTLAPLPATCRHRSTPTRSPTRASCSHDRRFIRLYSMLSARAVSSGCCPSPLICCPSITSRARTTTSRARPASPWNSASCAASSAYSVAWLLARLAALMPQKLLLSQRPNCRVQSITPARTPAPQPCPRVSTVCSASNQVCVVQRKLKSMTAPPMAVPGVTCENVRSANTALVALTNQACSSPHTAACIAAARPRSSPPRSAVVGPTLRVGAVLVVVAVLVEAMLVELVEVMVGLLGGALGLLRMPSLALASAARILSVFPLVAAVVALALSSGSVVSCSSTATRRTALARLLSHVES
jgi:hypothetical protein